MSMRYEEACMSNFNGLEIEVTLPRAKKGKRGGGLPTLLYRFPVSEGAVNPQSFVTASRGVVKLFPEGRKKKGGASSAAVARGVGGPPGIVEETEDDGGIEVGRVHMHVSVPGASPLVDPTGAKGRKYFGKGRLGGKM